MDTAKQVCYRDGRRLRLIYLQRALRAQPRSQGMEKRQGIGGSVSLGQTYRGLALL